MFFFFVFLVVVLSTDGGDDDDNALGDVVEGPSMMKVPFESAHYFSPDKFIKKRFAAYLS